MSKHTPGPWKVVSSYERDDAQFPVAQIEYLYVISAIEDRSLLGTVQADARLIAAAPDLLEALSELVEIVQDAIDQRSAKYLDSFTLQPAISAIKKATGESNE